MKGAKSRPEKGIIPVREAYESLFSALSAAPMSATDWEDSAFSPAGSRGNRAFSVALDDDTLSGQFLEQAPVWFAELAKKLKPSWEEAVTPVNLVPSSLSSLSPKDYVAFFNRKQLGANDANIALGTERLPPLPSDLLAEEVSARGAFLNTLNSVLAAEALVLQWGKDNPATPAVSALLKLALQPLWGAFSTFCRKKLELRTRALQGCLAESVLVQNLLASSPLSPELFDQEEVERVEAQAAQQAKPVF